LIPSTIIKFPPELNSKGPSIHKMICEPSGNRIGFAYTPAK
jgi:lactoylglutathione lyase